MPKVEQKQSTGESGVSTTGESMPECSPETLRVPSGSILRHPYSLFTEEMENKLALQASVYNIRNRNEMARIADVFF
jgi:hypothetical protein